MSPAEPSFDATFERALLAARYLLGARGAELSTGLDGSSRVRDEWLRRLTQRDREARAASLAAALAPIAHALEARRLA